MTTKMLLIYAFSEKDPNFDAVVSSCTCPNIKIYLRYHLSCVANLDTLVESSSVLNQVKTVCQWKDSIP